MARWSPVPPAAAAAYKTLGGAGRGAQAAVCTVHCVYTVGERVTEYTVYIAPVTHQTIDNQCHKSLARMMSCHIQFSSLK